MNILSIDNPKPYMGRLVKTEIIFNKEGHFQSLWQAERWCRDQGYSYGSSDYPNPIAITESEYNQTQKWHNFSKIEKNSVFGMITGDIRVGPVTVRIFS